MRHIRGHVKKSPASASSLNCNPSPHRIRTRPFTTYRTVSNCPWWWGPVFAPGWTTMVPAHDVDAPAFAWVIAAARLIPEVCGVFMSRSLAVYDFDFVLAPVHKESLLLKFSAAISFLTSQVREHLHHQTTCGDRVLRGFSSGAECLRSAAVASVRMRTPMSVKRTLIEERGSISSA